ncbi:MAG: polysaccharide pyruvyl transferase family protein [Candidatus Gracilibacteria bacterium]
MNIKKVVIAGNYGAKNLGDEMILEGVLEMVKNMFPKSEVTVLSADPIATEQTHKVKSAYLFPSGIRSFIKGILFGHFAATKQIVQECDLFILGGGGLFASIKRRANIIWGRQVKWVYHYKKPLFILGQSLENIKGFFGYRIVKRVFENAKVIAVRDIQSKAVLDALGIKKHIYVIPDAAFRVRTGEKYHSGGQGLIILRKSDRLSNQYLYEVGEFAKWLIKEENMDICFVNFQNADNSLHEKMSGYTKKEGICIVTPKSVNDVFDLYHKADFVLGMPLHSVIAAVKTETPFIALKYALKVMASLEYFDLSEWGMDIENLTCEKLKRKYKELKSKKFEVVRKMSIFNENALAELKNFEQEVIRNIF